MVQPLRGPSFKFTLYLVLCSVFLAIFLKFSLHSVPEVWGIIGKSRSSILL